MDLSIIIVNTNSRVLLQNCINSVLDNTTGIEYEIIVVDNNSTDGSTEMLRAEFPTVKLVQNKSNLGFPASNNRGFAISSGRYVLALNPDTVVLGNALTSMVRFMDDHHEAGACGCRLHNADGSLQPSWESFPTLFSEVFYGTPLNRIFSHRKRRPANGVYDVDWVSGACLMVRRETMNEVGAFDERFTPIYSEETDWCYRIKEHGWRIYYLPEPQVIHLGGQTTKHNRTWFFLQLQRNKCLFLRKHRGALYAGVYRALRILTCLARLVLAFVGWFLPGHRGEERKRLLTQQSKLLLMLFDPGLSIPMKAGE